MQTDPRDSNSAPDETVVRREGIVEFSGIRRNLSWLLLQRGVELLMRFLVGAWLARYLGPSEFGVYAYAVSFAALFTECAALGLDQIVVRELTRAPGRAGEVLATAVGLRVVAAAVGFGLAAAVAVAVEDDTRVRLAMIVLAGQLWFNPALVLELWFQSRVQSRYAVWTRLLASLVVAGLQCGLILAGQPLQAFVWVALAQALMTALGMVAAFRAFGPGSTRWLYSPSRARAMLRDSWPLLVSGLSISVYMRIDQVMLAQMAGVAAVGTYGAAVKVSELGYVVPTALAVSAFPAIVALRADSFVDEYHRRIQAICDALALYSYAFIVAVWVAAPLAVRLLFGSAYLDAVPVLRVHVVAVVFVALGVVYTRWLTIEGMTRLAMGSTAFGAILNVGLNCLLIPRMGAVGAAWATVASYAAATFSAPLLVPRLRSVLRSLGWALTAPLRIRTVLRQAFAVGPTAGRPGRQSAGGA